MNFSSHFSASSQFDSSKLDPSSQDEGTRLIQWVIGPLTAELPEFFLPFEKEPTKKPTQRVFHFGPFSKRICTVFDDKRSLTELQGMLRQGVSPSDFNPSKLGPSNTRIEILFIGQLDKMSRFTWEDIIESLGALPHFVCYKIKTDTKTKLRDQDIDFTFYLDSKTINPGLAAKRFTIGSKTGFHAQEARRLSERAANDLTPKNYVENVKQAVQKLRWAKFNFYGIRQLKSLKAGAFLAVTRAEDNPASGIVHLQTKSKAGVKKIRRIAIVGKGLCFDTGGYNLKPGNSMWTMHRDMTGSAITFELFKYLGEMIQKEKLPVELHAYLAVAENLISPTAYRPNEVVRASNGVSIEIVNTDAEGRMVLADTLVLASKSKPDLLLDFATLTGSMVRAIGTTRSGVHCNREELIKLLYQAGDSSGERVWHFPIGEEFEADLESDIADVKQCTLGGNADHIYAATFLQKFLDPKIAWVHMDLSSEECKGGLGLSSHEVTGFGVRWGAHFLRRWIDGSIQ